MQASMRVKAPGAVTTLQTGLCASAASAPLPNRVDAVGVGLFQALDVAPGLPEASPSEEATMKITKVEPLLLDRFLYVRIHTDAGITGIGESGTWGQLE